MTTSKRTALCAVLAILLTAWTLFIFSNSMKTKAESASSSKKVSQAVKSVVDPKNKIPEEKFHKSVRKTAHVLEFCAQGIIASALAWILYGKKRKLLLLFMPAVVCIFTAAGDEYLQSHTGRGAAFTDVLIDTGGAVIGILLLYGVFFAVQKWQIVKQM